MKNERSKILLIEDDLTLRKMYAARLLKAGYQVFEAEDAERGTDLVKTEKPDLIILDLILPKVNGFEFLKRLKKNTKTKKIPVLVLTSLGQDSDRQEALDMGAVDYLIKPETTPLQILDKVVQYLK